MSIAPPPATTAAFLIALRTIITASCRDRSASSTNASLPPREYQRRGFRRGAPSKDVEPLGSDLFFLKEPARAQAGGFASWFEVGDGRLDGCAGRGDDAVHVVRRDPPGAKDVAVGEELRGQVADRQPREHDGGSGVGDGLELGVDDVPGG